MLLKMHHKIADDVAAAILGVFGYGICLTNITWANELLRFCVPMASAFFAGFVGFIGKRAGSWALRKIRLFFLKNKP